MATTKRSKKAVAAQTEENEKAETLLNASLSVARSVVEGWLPASKEQKQKDVGSKKAFQEAQTAIDSVKDRPTRLGLGATHLSHKQAQQLGEAIVDEKIKKGVEKDKKRRLEEEGETDHKQRPKKQKGTPKDKEVDDDDESESRVKSIAALVKEKDQPFNNPNKSKGKGKQNKGSEQPKKDSTDDVWLSNWPEGEDDEDAADESSLLPANEPSSKIQVKEINLDDERKKSGITEGAEAPSKPAPRPVKERTEVINGEEVIVRRKKSKKRSKQKNLRKDNRPPEKKPTYMTQGAADYRAPKPAFPRKIIVPTQSSPVATTSTSS